MVEQPVDDTESERASRRVRTRGLQDWAATPAAGSALTGGFYARLAGNREFGLRRIESLGVAKILSIAGGDGAAVPDGHGIHQTGPEGLWLAFDLRRVFQPAPSASRIGVPFADRRRVPFQKAVEPGIDLHLADSAAHPPVRSSAFTRPVSSESRVYAVGRRRVKVRERGRWEAAVRFAHARRAG